MKLRLALVALFVFLSAALPLLAQQRPTPFSADMKMTGGRGMDMTGKMYFGGEKIRMDMNAPQGTSVMLVDPVKRTSYMLMPEQKMYMEFNAAMARRRTPDMKPMDPENPCANTPDTTCKKVGTETVNGRNCDKWEFTTSGRVTNYWVDKRLMFPVKMTGEGTSWELTNIKEGPQDAKLFEIPPDYQKMDMGGMMGGRGPGN